MPKLLAQCTEWRGSEPRGRMTVLHLAQPVEGGVARVVTALARAQVRAGLRVVVACPRGGTLERDAAAAGALTAHWPAVREPGARLALEMHGVRRLVRRFRPDLVHAHSAKAGLAARLALRARVPTIHQPHAWSFEAARGRTARQARAWERYATRWADRVLCVSAAERETGREAGLDARWSVVRNGVDFEKFTAAPSGPPPPGALPQPAGPAALRERAGAAPLVMCVGRLCEQKGQRHLLAAWPRIAARVPGARLVLVGDGPDRERLRRSAPGGVVFAGARERVEDWYAVADLVVLPSLWEGMALTPLEAMACGRPVVVTDVDGSRELLPPGQETTCLVPPGDAAALADTVAALCLDARLREELGQAAAKHVHAEFDVRETAAAVLELYREVLGERCAPGVPAGLSEVR
ncbi:glycosyltransferase family 4 protein [Streptomyces tubbatahanensis]|uniref:Glycosyltransferase family 4 protein n=1 Tax=Streptomyces tubbatahanensis TaxID=2923272 RepID=A0ABY3Y0N8_9ACTN|nr:glycosyltransferase family 4 protein [Streptomyces tubbatahanensis]UNT00177.1 glycosyltransferase family 4 protein [Streptomyces tubbatahanensis]